MFKDFFIKLKAKREIKKINRRNKMIRKKELLERIEILEEKINCLECYTDKLYDENEHLLYKLNVLLGRNPTYADPTPYDSSVDALCEILERLKRNDEIAIDKLSDRISHLEFRSFQENSIKEKADEVIDSAEKVINSFDLVKFVRDLFMPEKTQKKTKPSEKTKAKCEKKSCKNGGR